jgi:hypothetical protein
MKRRLARSAIGATIIATVIVVGLSGIDPG